jgi:BirA family biotin operon repressor/biotin-[acetyl-CoA-carboxylase] ligase
MFMGDFIEIPCVLQQTMVAQVQAFHTLGSTNDWAKRRAAEPSCPLPLLVVAEAQTAGRGRGANRWWSAPGSLIFSLVLPPEQLPSQLGSSPLISIATAVAVTETIVPLLGEHQAGIHWPNDVVAGGRKIAGILVEVLGNRRHVIGIGLNVNNRLAEAPPEILKRATTLWELTHTLHDLTTVLIDVLRRLEVRVGQLTTPVDLVRRANVLCLQQGMPLNLRQGDRTIAGRCAGIAVDGGLLLDTPQGRQTFMSGVLV